MEDKNDFNQLVNQLKLQIIEMLRIPQLVEWLSKKINKS